MRSLYGLTPAESRVADLLLQGLDAGEAANRLGLTLGTVRLQTKRVMAKTGTRRQAETDEAGVVVAGGGARVKALFAEGRGAVAGFDDAGVAGEVELGYVELVGARRRAGRRRRWTEAWASRTGRLVSTPAGEAVALVGELLLGELNVRLSDLDELLGGVDVEHGGTDLGFDVRAGACEALLEAHDLGADLVLLAALLGFVEDGELEAARWRRSRRGKSLWVWPRTP